MIRTVELVAVAAIAACSSSSDREGTSSQDVVGGRLEPTLYPAMGFLAMKLTEGPHAGEIWRPNCGATLIAPHAALTAAHCVQEKTEHFRTVVGVGFGDGLTAPLHDVVGTWREWTNPKYYSDAPDSLVDSRHDIAVIELADTIDIEPMPITREPVTTMTRGTFIGYGRTQYGFREPSDTLVNRPDHRDRYPGLRKTFDVQVLTARGAGITVVALPTANGLPGGSACHGDSGSALILADGSVAGTTITMSSNVDESVSEEDDVTCTPHSAVVLTNLQLAGNPAFIERRLAEIAARHPTR